MPDLAGDSCTAAFKSACCASPRAGGNPRSARISRLWALPCRWRRPIGQWCGGPFPVPRPPPNPAILGPAAAGRTTVPAPGTSATESSAGANPWHSSATVRGIAPSPAHPSPTPLAHPQKLTLSLLQFTLCFCAFHLGFGLGLQHCEATASTSYHLGDKAQDTQASRGAGVIAVGAGSGLTC